MKKEEPRRKAGIQVHVMITISIIEGHPEAFGQMLNYIYTEKAVDIFWCKSQYRSTSKPSVLIS